MKLEIAITNQNVDAQEALDLDSKINTFGDNKHIKLVLDVSRVHNMSIAAIGVVAAAVRTFKMVVIKGCNATIQHKLDTLGLTSLVKLT